MKLVSLLFKHVVGNQASILLPILSLLPAPRGMATVYWNEFYVDIIWETKHKFEAKGQLISKGLFWCHRFDQKTNDYFF